MCISMQPSVMSDTRLYAGDAMWKDTYVHVLAYQNKATSTLPNAMILPIPASAELGPENTVDATGFKRFLEDIGEATRRRYRGGPASKTLGTSSSRKMWDVGSYTVLLTNDPKTIRSDMLRVPEARRPEVSTAVLRSFSVNYPSWPIAVCCWDGNIEPEPLLWWYEPKLPDTLFLPALDAHDGRAPDLTREVDVDHQISFGSAYRTRVGAATVAYRDRLSPIAQAILPQSVAGTKIDKVLPNGDFTSVAGIYAAAQRVTPGRRSEIPRLSLSGWS